MKEIDIIVTFSGYVPDDVTIADIEESIDRELADSVYMGCQDEEENDCYADRRQTIATEKTYNMIIG